MPETSKINISKIAAMWLRDTIDSCKCELVAKIQSYDCMCRGGHCNFKISFGRGGVCYWTVVTQGLPILLLQCHFLLLFSLAFKTFNTFAVSLTSVSLFKCYCKFRHCKVYNSLVNKRPFSTMQTISILPHELALNTVMSLVILITVKQSIARQLMDGQGLNKEY